MNHWKKYTDKKKGQPHNKLLEEAMDFVVNKDSALDLGAGALNDTIYLVSKGFKEIIAIDSERNADEVYKELPQDKVQYLTKSFEEYDFPADYFDLVSAQYALPFASPQSIEDIFQNIKQSLKLGGIFTGQLFGPNDEWNTSETTLTFLNKESVEKLLDGMEVIKLDETERDNKTALGVMKHWHVFDIIARKV